MTVAQIPANIIPFDKNDRKKATVDILNHITEILFYFFEEQEEDLDDAAVLNEFLQTMWDISILSLASAGMKIIGATEDGGYVATFKPVESVKKFMIEEDYGDESQLFYEDFVETDPDEESGLGIHESRLID